MMSPSDLHKVNPPFRLHIIESGVFMKILTFIPYFISNQSLLKSILNCSLHRLSVNYHRATEPKCLPHQGFSLKLSLNCFEGAQQKVVNDYRVNEYCSYLHWKPFLNFYELNQSLSVNETLKCSPIVILKQYV